MSWPPKGLLTPDEDQRSIWSAADPGRADWKPLKAQNELHARMVCPAGRNQVYVRSPTYRNRHHTAADCLKCSLRRVIGQTRVF